MSDENIQTPFPATDGEGLIAYMFTNHPDQGVFMQQLLDMFYSGCFNNTIGLASMRNNATGKEELVIVGVENVGDLTKTYPLARVLAAEEVTNYSGPDGKGGWLDEEEAPEQLELFADYDGR
jgi:hypothetical protein